MLDFRPTQFFFRKTAQNSTEEIWSKGQWTTILSAIQAFFLSYESSEIGHFKANGARMANFLVLVIWKR